MSINGINIQTSQTTGTARNLATAYTSTETPTPETPPQIKQREDSIEISAEARELSENKTNENFGRIQSQINAGFYNRPDIIRQTANKLSQSIREIKPV